MRLFGVKWTVQLVCLTHHNNHDGPIKRVLPVCNVTINQSSVLKPVREHVALTKVSLAHSIQNCVDRDYAVTSVKINVTHYGYNDIRPRPSSEYNNTALIKHIH